MENIILIDAQKGLVVDSCDASSAHLVYGSAFFKGLSTGGNVSEAMVHLSDRVCYQSVARCGGQLYVLGRSQVTHVCIGDPISQLEAFESRGEVMSAVLYALDIFNGKIALRESLPRVRKMVSERFPRLILLLLEKTMHRIEQGSAVDLYEHYKKHISILMRASVTTKNFNLLYRSVLPKVEEDPIARSVFFDAMDEAIQDEQLQNPPPELIHDYIAYLEQENQLPLLESAVKHLPIESLDLHQIMTLCNKHNLYDSIIFLHNKAFKSFLLPLEQMLENVSQFCQKDVLSDCEMALGDKLLLYISCCLGGIPYQGNGALTEEEQRTVPLKVFRCLVAVQSKGGAITGKYANLRILLHLDAHQFLNAIFNCSDSSVLAAHNCLDQIVDILYTLVMDMGKENPTICCHFLSFLGLVLKKNLLFIPKHRVSDLVDSVFAAEWSVGSTKDSTEQCIVDVINCVDGLDLDHILQMALKLPHVEVAAFIYTQKEEYNKLVHCYLTSWNRRCQSIRSQDVFLVIQNLLDTISGKHLESFKTYIKNVILDLNSLDSTKTAQLILERFQGVLEHHKNLPYDLLWNCLKKSMESGVLSLTGKNAIDEKLFNSAFSGYVTANELSIADSELREGFDFLLNEILLYWIALAAASDFCLNIAVEHKLNKSAVTLLRARNLPDRAFELLFQNLKEGSSERRTLVKQIDDLLDLCHDLQNEARGGTGTCSSSSTFSRSPTLQLTRIWVTEPVPSFFRLWKVALQELKTSSVACLNTSPSLTASTPCFRR
ncbi:hypothetical protein L596_011160 [Steinernema carpocapsae]|uniref:Vacuolar protein sorting-associated protein 8 central domain-containing protein n=1 Tax=Steinernema carpocapsae TaxID=34508 RepID=A0A4U5NTH5_STECR|nr:hypothetical protein L596_011160 [Steinernema carpocapsae]